MAAAGPWPASRRIAVAVSGGADSLCLASLASSWGHPTALIIDHGLRPESAAEARHAASQLRIMGVPYRILTLRTLRRGPGLAARARRARYQALAGAMQDAGLSDLLLGHHAGDQAETILMRQQAGSGQAGLAGMAAITETATHRIVRPLLGAGPATLRRHLRQAGIAWIEDPSNRDTTVQRPRLRQTLEAEPEFAATLLACAAQAAGSRARHDAEIAGILARRCTIFPEGHAILTPGPVEPAALAALLRTLAGEAYPANTASIARLAADPSPATLGGIRILGPGRLGPGLLLVREAAAMQGEIPAAANATWDSRFHIYFDGPPAPDATIGPLAADSAHFRSRTHLPSAVLRTLPAIRHGGAIVAIPHIGFFKEWTLHSLRVTLSPPVPLSGAPFARMQPHGSFLGDAQRRGTPHVP